MIIKKNGIPLYFQLREKLLYDFSVNYETGEQIPTETQLSTSYDVHRGTVRKALSTLVNDKILERRRPLGTFLMQKPEKLKNGEKKLLNIALCFSLQSGDIITSPFYSHVFHGIYKHGEGKCNFSTYSLDMGGDSAAKAFERMHQVGIDGVLFMGAFENEVFEHFRESNLPAVHADSSTTGSAYDSLSSNNIEASMEAVKYLISLGHHRIAVLAGPRDDKVVIERLSGWKLALLEAGIAPDENKLLIQSASLNHIEGFKAASRAIQDGVEFTALFAANDCMGVGAIQAMQQAGIRIPEDVSVVGFDDTIESQFYNPPLTTMHVDKFLMGEIAIKRLLERINNRNLPIRHIKLSAKLAERSSCISIK